MSLKEILHFVVVEGSNLRLTFICFCLRGKGAESLGYLDLLLSKLSPKGFSYSQLSKKRRHTDPR